MVFILHFVDFVYHVYLFGKVKAFLHVRDRSHLVQVSHLSGVFLDSTGSYFVNDFCISGHQEY